MGQIKQFVNKFTEPMTMTINGYIVKQTQQFHFDIRNEEYKVHHTNALTMDEVIEFIRGNPLGE